MAKVFAVLESGGKQYRVSEGDIIFIEKLDNNLTEGDKIAFETILLLDNGEETKIGTPHLSGKKIEATLLEKGKGKKIQVIRYKAKSRHFRKKGHRQEYMKVRIDSIPF